MITKLRPDLLCFPLKETPVVTEMSQQMSQDNPHVSTLSSLVPTLTMSAKSCHIRTPTGPRYEN